MNTDLQLKEKEETRVPRGVPLSAAETNLPKAQKDTSKRTDIQGKTKNRTIANMQKKGKRNKYRLAIEGKRRNTGVQGGVPLSAAEKNLPKA